jgi:hypothetical protein
MQRNGNLEPTKPISDDITANAKCESLGAEATDFFPCVYKLKIADT